jgi:hypothetical protein
MEEKTTIICLLPRAHFPKECRGKAALQADLVSADSKPVKNEEEPHYEETD